MHYVYILEPLTPPITRYIGYTTDLRARLTAHNAGQDLSTAARDHGSFGPTSVSAKRVVREPLKRT